MNKAVILEIADFNFYAEIKVKRIARALVFHFCEIRYFMFKSLLLRLIHLIFRIYEYSLLLKIRTIDRDTVSYLIKHNIKDLSYT
jgi:hypothetical protein